MSIPPNASAPFGHPSIPFSSWGIDPSKDPGAAPPESAAPPKSPLSRLFGHTSPSSWRKLRPTRSAAPTPFIATRAAGSPSTALPCHRSISSPLVRKLPSPSHSSPPARLTDPLEWSRTLCGAFPTSSYFQPLEHSDAIDPHRLLEPDRLLSNPPRSRSTGAAPPELPPPRQQLTLDSNPNTKSAQDFTAALVTHPELRHSLILCHNWFVPTFHLLQALGERILSDGAQRLFLTKCLSELLRTFPIDTLSEEGLFELFCQLPPTREFSALRQTFRAAAWPTPPAALTTRSAFTLNEEAATPLNACTFREIQLAIEADTHGPTRRALVRAFAWNIKKWHATFFTQIHLAEFAAYKSNPLSPAAPHIRAFVQHTNLFIYFFVSRILRYPEAATRARCCQLYIELMRASLHLHNLSAAFFLLGVLNHSCISRLKHTWQQLSEKRKRQLQEIEKLFQPDGNYRNYRAHLEELEHAHKKITPKQGVIPLLNHYLTCFTFIDDGNPSYLKEGGINLNKVQLIAQQQLTFTKYQDDLRQCKTALLDQTEPCDLSYRLEITAEVLNKHFGDIENAFEALYQTSMQLEPPTSPPPREKPPVREQPF